MKLFLFDTKHQQVVGSLEVGKLCTTEVELINKVIAFLEDQQITDGRYKNLALADDIEIVYEDNEPELVIRNAR